MTTENAHPEHQDDLEALRAENARLKKVVTALMDRAERQVSTQESGFNLFQSMIVLEDRVRNRTKELEVALRENEKATRALRISEQRYQTLITQSLVGIGIYENENIVFANSKLAEIFGYKVDELLLCDLANLIDKKDRASFSAHLHGILSESKTQETTVFCGITKDHRRIFIDLMSARLPNEDKEAIIFICKDITEEVEAHKEIQLLNAKLRDMSIRDSLTGLFNRRYMDEMLAREIARAKRKNAPLSLIMGDLDRFKNINDKYGHPAGDQALKLFSQMIIYNTRSSDIACRYGGEEFLLICPEMTAEKALERAEKLRSTFGENKFSFGGKSISISASFGVATYPQDGKEPHELILAADMALLDAKQAGRNRVMLASQQLDSEPSTASNKTQA